jgi:restriction system protein
MSDEKRNRLRALVERRKSGLDNDWLPAGYRRLADFGYESEYVVPWSTSACAYDSDVMLMAQDWASSDLLEQSGKEEMKRVGRDVTLKSNIAIDLLLKQYLNLEFHQTYATDTFVYVKPGGMSAPVKWGALVQSARLYALPQIEIIRPRMVICLGRGANYSALHNAALGSMPPALEGDSPKGPILWKNSEIYGVTHPSRARMYKTRVQAEWEFLAHRLGQLRGESQFG